MYRKYLFRPLTFENKHFIYIITFKSYAFEAAGENEEKKIGSTRRTLRIEFRRTSAVDD